MSWASRMMASAADRRLPDLESETLRVVDSPTLPVFDPEDEWFD